MGKLKHVYMRCEIWSREVCGKPQEQVGNETAADVMAEIRWETLTEDPPGNVMVLCPYPEVQENFDETLRKGTFDPSRVSYLHATPITKEVSVPPTPAHQVIVENAGNGEKQVDEVPFEPVHKKKMKFERRLHVGSRRNMLAVKKHVEEANASLLVLVDPNEEEGDLNCLSDLRRSCPELDVIIYHRYTDKYGVETTGDPDNWEYEFPVMGDCELPSPEVIVDEILLKGCIHVWAGMFESYKTMAGIELSSAILDNRKVFDEFQVRQQYPILSLNRDMDPALFQDYAKPFGLLKQQDFRWERSGAEMLHALDSPVMQRAVRGRILILDTMLDFASITEAFQSKEWIEFFSKLRSLLNVCGCVAIVMLVHPTKTGAKSNTIDPNEYLKDSVTFSGKIDVGFGFANIPNSQVIVERIKGRGFKKKKFSFTLAVNDEGGNCWFDKGKFPVYLKPGEAGGKQDHVAQGKGGRKPNPEKDAIIKQIVQLKNDGKSFPQIAEQLQLSLIMTKRYHKDSFDSETRSEQQ